jgi:hypothetical protein
VTWPLDEFNFYFADATPFLMGKYALGGLVPRFQRSQFKVNPVKLLRLAISLIRCEAEIQSAPICEAQIHIVASSFATPRKGIKTSSHGWAYRTSETASDKLSQPFFCRKDRIRVAAPDSSEFLSRLVITMKLDYPYKTATLEEDATVVLAPTFPTAYHYPTAARKVCSRMPTSPRPPKWRPPMVAWLSRTGSASPPRSLKALHAPAEIFLTLYSKIVQVSLLDFQNYDLQPG